MATKEKSGHIYTPSVCALLKSNIRALYTITTVPAKTSSDSKRNCIPQSYHEHHQQSVFVYHSIFDRAVFHSNDFPSS